VNSADRLSDSGVNCGSHRRRRHARRRRQDRPGTALAPPVAVLGLRDINWQAIGREVAAMGTAALSMPLRWLVADLEFDPTARHPIPVVFVHGLLGDRTNFLPMRTYLTSVGIRSFATFSYGPRIDHHRLADELGRAIDGIRDATGARQVDLVGHSLGGLVARYVTESSRQRAVRRLVTLGAPYYTDAYPEQELAIFGDQDFLVRPPDRDGIRVIPDAGHLALLYHPAVLRAVAAYLLRPRVIVPRLRSAREAA